MERLTRKMPRGYGVIDGYELNTLRGAKAVIDRLAVYEDTGLEPEEIAKIREDVENGYMKSTARRCGISLDRLRELAQADREGRCGIPPVKLHQKIFRVLMGRFTRK